MAIVTDREVSLPLGIVVERRKSTHPWATWTWKPVSVFMNGAADAEWKEMVSGEDWTHYHAATLPLVLHRKETEALCLNLMLDIPELYIVMQESDDEDSDFPLTTHLVTASSYEALDYLESGEDIIEKVEMPDAVAAFIQAFIDEHHVEEKFKKRRRDKLNIEEHKFGKQPIFTSKTRH